ncbi:double C2-like domain-containing protein beta [Amphibalanus amphitrite]|uniref:double C2-like domain-containing protein beta n=1 Tax=Amphibalanus amphitrite TaxID=1232801 RepID=UPI001C9294A1|nr:double C2-like domain-containing protein beta [Amphibalanus amphitrite]
MVDPAVESIHCCVHRVRGLCPLDGEIVNAYVKLHLVPGLHKTNKLRTRTVSGSSDAEFNETLTYCNVHSDVVASSTLWVSVLDENPNGHDVLGETLVWLADIPPHRLHFFCKPLLPIGSGDCDSYQGRILLSLKYVTTRRVLVVGVVRCVDLPAPDGNGVPDPFVKVQLRPAPGQFRTAICWKSPNPKFNEEFCFRCRRSELPRHTLDLRIYDKDISKSNDFIGSLQLSIDSHGARLRHWFDALNYVDTRHDRWHELSATLPGPPPS